MKKIIVGTSDLWGYFLRNKEALKTCMHEVASNDEYGISIYLTEEGGLPRIIVEADGDEVCDEMVESEVDCEKTAEKIYDAYLTSNVVHMLADGTETETEASLFLKQSDIDEREAELEDALYLFLDTVCDGLVDTYIDDDAIVDIKEHILEYIARKHDVPIRRPMFLEDEKGEDFYEEYPYGCMVFDDENNPIYK